MIFIHRGANSEPMVYNTLETLNNHFVLCNPGMNPMVKGKCDLGMLDNPAETRGEKNKKSRKVYGAND